MGDVTMSSRIDIQQPLSNLVGDKRAELKSILHRERRRVSLTADAWSYKIYCRYVLVMAHRINKNGR